MVRFDPATLVNEKECRPYILSLIYAIHSIPHCIYKPLVTASLQLWPGLPCFLFVGRSVQSISLMSKLRRCLMKSLNCRSSMVTNSLVSAVDTSNEYGPRVCGTLTTSGFFIGSTNHLVLLLFRLCAEFWM